MLSAVTRTSLSSRARFLPPLSRAMSSSAPSTSYKKVLTPQTINPNVLNVEYAVRGALSNRANEYADLIARGEHRDRGLPFDSVVTANIGNPQQQPYLAQNPLTFWRQVSPPQQRRKISVP